MNEMPEKVNELCSLKHDQVVCAVAIGSNEQQRQLVYTGGKGCVKVSSKVCCTLYYWVFIT